MNIERVIEKLKLNGPIIGELASKGDKKCMEIVNLYAMYYKCQDACTGVVLCKTYEEWEKEFEAKIIKENKINGVYENQSS